MFIGKIQSGTDECSVTSIPIIFDVYLRRFTRTVSLCCETHSCRHSVVRLAAIVSGHTFTKLRHSLMKNKRDSRENVIDAANQASIDFHLNIIGIDQKRLHFLRTFQSLCQQNPAYFLTYSFLSLFHLRD